MNFIINDFNIFYKKYGKGKNNIIILPGWGNNRETFNYMINFFKKDFTIYILDYPGFGNSTFPNRDLTLDDYTNLIIHFIKSKNIFNPIIIAHSFGGRIAINMEYKKEININKIILIDSAGIKPRKTLKQIIKQNTYKLLKKLKYILPKKYKEKYINKLIKIFGSNDFKNLNPNIRKTFINIVNNDLKNKLNKINCATLLIWGEKDIDTPLTDAYIMNNRIKDSGLVILKYASHFSYLEFPNYTNNIIYEFIKHDLKKETIKK